MPKCDVIVIGGGPAGTSAAIRCVLGGASVVLLELSAFPRHRPGETIHPGIEPLLKQLGVWQSVEAFGFVRHAGIRICSNQREQFQTFGSDVNGEWMGLQAWRAEFDKLLLNRAIELGVCIMQPCKVRHAIVRDDAVVGVESDRGNIFADFTIDAAGGRHWLANELCLPMHTESPQVFARYGYVEGDYAQAHEAPILRCDANGWTWIARVRERTYQWTRLSFGRGDEDNSTQAEIETPVELLSLDPIGHTRGADVTWRRVSIPAGPGYFLCGDAAAVLDPASSHGVLKAVMSGIYVGHLIQQIRTNSKSKNAAAAEYSSWLSRLFNHDVEALRTYYA